MNKQYQDYQAQIPLYLSEEMPDAQRSEIEAFAAAHPEFAAEIGELRSVFATMSNGLGAASNTDFKLSPARRAEILRDSSANVVTFSDVSSSSVKSSRQPFTRRLIHRTGNWAAMAAALLFVSYLGFESGRSQYPDGIPQVRLAVDSTIAELPADYTNEIDKFRPAYGLDRPDSWRIGAGPISGARISLALGGLPKDVAVVRETSPARLYVEQPEYFGLEGPTPYFDFNSVNDAEAI